MHTDEHGFLHKEQSQCKQYEYYRDLLLSFPKPDKKGTADEHKYTQKTFKYLQ